MLSIQNLFKSPEYYPLRVDFQKQIMAFVRMSRDTYRDSVFLDSRTRYLRGRLRTLRLDDLLLAAASTESAARNVNYILHPAFCCSTLLARYFELLPFCLVLKEPLLLTQLAISSPEALPKWKETFELSIRLLTRTYDETQTVIIKVHEPCNSLGQRLLKADVKSTVTFLMTPLRHFILSVLKSEERRSWVRRRVCGEMASGGKAWGLEDVLPSDLSDAQAAACMWMRNNSLCEQLSASSERARVFLLESDQLIESAYETLRALVRFCRLPLDEIQIAWLVQHPSMRRYSKDVSLAYDANSRRREFAELERRFGHDADLGAEWATCHSILPIAV
jgi:hypothetical protein